MGPTGMAPTGCSTTGVASMGVVPVPPVELDLHVPLQKSSSGHVYPNELDSQPMSWQVRMIPEHCRFDVGGTVDRREPSCGRMVAVTTLGFVEMVSSQVCVTMTPQSVRFWAVKPTAAQHPWLKVFTQQA